MIVELASLPPVVQAYIKNEQQVQMVIKDGQVHISPLSQQLPQSQGLKPRVAGQLAHLNTQTDDSVWFEPMSDEELAWWRGDRTDEYGLSQ